MFHDRGSTTPLKRKSHTSQELTLNYLCDSSLIRDREERPFLEEDFLQVNPDSHGKKVKSETLNLSLSLDSFNLSPDSQSFSHNISCSNFDCSRSTEQFWVANEGTNGSVHSKFKPSLFGGDCSYSNFFPSELPAKPKERKTQKDSGLKEILQEKVLILGQKNTSLREIIQEQVPVIAKKLREISPEQLEGLRSQFKRELSEEFPSLKRRLERRTDLNVEILSKASRIQLEGLLAVKYGEQGFLSGKISASNSDLAEVFLELRCRNLNCRSVLPVDDCDCKICTENRGFCSACMCPICFTFDCAQNTCSWVGCDVCSHWCHASCGIKKNLIRPGKDGEMQFNCVGCGHMAEMFGFVRDVFVYCGKNWGGENLGKELECVRMIFEGSEDGRGRELCELAGRMKGLLERKVVSAQEACGNMVQFLKDGRASEQPAKEKEAKTIKPPHVIDSEKKESMMKSERSIRDGEESLESIIRFKVAEAELFQRLADQARREVEGYRQIVRGKREKLEEEYAAKVGKLCLREAEERRKRKLDELKCLENSHYDYHNMKIKMQAEISGLLERMEATKQQWIRL